MLLSRLDSHCFPSSDASRLVPEPDTYCYRRYLRAKRTVDARALNRRVWTQFIQRVSETASSPVRILEVGGGIGATVERIVEALEHESVTRIQYTFVDIAPEHVEAATASLGSWAERKGYDVSGRETQVWTDGPVDVDLQFVTTNLLRATSALSGDSYDAIVAQAVLDLLNIPEALGALRPLLDEDGLWYLPIHFDGITAFEPPIDPALDARIERLYHESMAGSGDREGGRAGAHCGRRLLTHLLEGDATLLETGSSDWVVIPRAGEYPGDEAYFLHHVLHFVNAELSEHPAIQPGAFQEWLDTRRRQIEEAKLVYIAHQLDVLAQEANAS